MKNYVLIVGVLLLLVLVPGALATVEPSNSDEGKHTVVRQAEDGRLIVANREDTGIPEFDLTMALDRNRQAAACTTPALVSPADGAQLSTISPEYVWDATWCGEFDYLKLEVATDPQFTNKVMAVTLMFKTSSWRFWEKNLDPATTYYWRVYAICGGWPCTPSDIWSFRTGVGGEVLPGPTLYLPPDGATLPVGTPVPCDWDDVPGATDYIVVEGIADSSYWPRWYHKTGGDSESVTGGLEPNTTYGWWVRPVNDYAIGDRSEIRHFTTGPEWDGEIEEIEINQVLGRQLSDPPKYVAGKNTVVRVFLSQQVEIDTDHQRVTVKRDGKLVTTLEPQKMGKIADSTDKLIFSCDSLEACDHWEAGSYTFEIEVNGQTTQKAADFQDRRSLQILIVPLKAKLDGLEQSVSSKSWQYANDFLRHTYPVANDGIVWHVGSTVNVTGFDLTSELQDKSGWPRYGISLFLSLIRRLAPEYDFVVGVLPSMPVNCKLNPCNTSICGCSRGWTYPDMPRVVIVMEDGSYTGACSGNPTKTSDGLETTIAHELGHTFGLGDEYDNPRGTYVCDANPPPAHYRGHEEGTQVPDDCEGAFSCGQSTEAPFLFPTGPRAGEDAGSGVNVSSDLWHPFEQYSTWSSEARIRTARGPISIDMMNFMGSSFSHDYVWVSPITYNHLFDQLALLDQAVASPSERVVLVSGIIDGEDDVSLYPWYQISTTLDLPISATYSIEAVDALSHTLASQGFEAKPMLDDSASVTATVSSFMTTIPFIQGTVAFHIRRGSDVLMTVPVSTNVPTMTVTSPTLGETVSGVYTVTWTSSDPDGDECYHIVQYSPDGQDWLALTAPITETQLSVDFDTLSGGNQAYIKVLVTDGVNTVERISQPFSVTFKAPEVAIVTPITGTMYEPESNVVLLGRAYDSQDKMIQTDEALTWHSDVDGPLGRGELLNVDDLSEGWHIITLSATNSLSMTTFASVTIEIGYHHTYLPLVRSALPSQGDITVSMAILPAVSVLAFGLVLVRIRGAGRHQHSTKGSLR